MNIVFSIIYNVGILFMMMIPGYLLKKLKMIPEGFGKGLSNLVLYIAQPALVFLAYLKDFSKEILINSIYVLVISIAAHALFAAIAIPVFKKATDEKARMLKFATIFSNAAFMGIPLISVVLEDTYPGATLYASIYNITFNLFLWSLGVAICTRGRDINRDGVDDYREVTSLTPDADEGDSVKNSSGSILKAILHPITIAALLGLLFFILPINAYVPSIIVEALTMLKNLVAPLSMTVIGIRLADMTFKGMLSDTYMYIFLALRHLSLPLAVLRAVKLLSLIGIEIPYVVSMVSIILAACPAASSATMFAEKFSCDAIYVSRLVAVSTLLSIITMPLIILLV